MATNGNVNFQEDSAQQASQPNSQSSLGKDEIGWYFVEQFYTTMSKSPEKLHLFYSKRSQFVNGMEAEVASVAVGREAIKERIKNLDFQECKVRVTNVDSQSSEDNIVIQVIGELSNKSAEPKKFVQTFLLAKQPSGYFVLNDIVRYIDENVDEDHEATAPETEAAPAEVEAPAVEEAKAEPETEAVKADEPAQEAEPAKLDTAAVDQKLEDASSAAKEETPAASEPAAEPAVEVEPTVLETKEEAQPEPVVPEKAAEEVKEEEMKKVETPKDPAPTPAAPKAAPKAAPVAAEPEKPKEPPKPMTWASMASRMAGTVRAAVPLPKAATPTAAQTQTRPAAPAATQQKPAATSQPTEAAPAAAHASKDDEWQSVGADSKRQNRPVSVSGPGSQGPGQEGAMVFVKFVNDKVKSDDLKAILSQYGELVYFDVHRQKNCAFAEYATPAGYQAAVAANPHTVNGETIVVEQRRPKATAFGGSSYGRGPAGGRGRAGLDGQRTGSQGSGRGGFTQQARGGRGGAPRGAARPAAQASS